MYLSIVQQYPNVGIPELEIVRPCSKNNVTEKYDRSSINIDIDYQFTM